MIAQMTKFKVIGKVVPFLSDDTIKTSSSGKKRERLALIYSLLNKESVSGVS